jgi:hypothetical protein
MNAIKDIKEMNLVRWMGAITFVIIQSMMGVLFFSGDAISRMSVVQVELVIFGILFGSTATKNYINYRRESCSNGSKQIPAM